jgi:hypothetical protein
LTQLAADVAHLRGLPAWVTNQQVIEATPTQPDRLGRGEAHNALKRWIRRHNQLNQRHTTDGLRSDPDAFAA